MTKDEYDQYDLSQPHVLTWREWRNWFWFLLCSPRAGKLKIKVTDFGMSL